MDTGLVKARWPVLGLTLVLSAGIIFYLSTYWGAIAATAIEAVAIAVCAAFGSLWLLRSWQLALIAALIPVLITTLALGILTPIAIAEPMLCGVLIPHALATALLTASGIATAIQYGFSCEVCAGNEPDSAAWSAMRRVRMMAVVALSVVALWRTLLLLPGDVMRLSSRAVQAPDVTVLATVVTALSAAAICFFVLPLALGAIRFSEGFIANANRVREWRERILGVLTFVVMPRWALSLTGISVVFGAIVFFGAPRSPSPVLALWRAEGLMFPVTVGGIGLISAVALRDWRAVFTCALPPALAATVTAALSVRAAQMMAIDVTAFAVLPSATGFGLLSVTAAVGAGFSYWVAGSISAYRRLDDPLMVAFERSLSDVAPAMICAAAATGLVLVPLGLWFVPLVCALAAMILTPALTAVIEMPFPRLKSVEELYGKARAEPR